MELRTGRSCHALYNPEYHLVLAAKYRKKCINEAMFGRIEEQAKKIAGGEEEEINYEPEHLHILLSLPPLACISKVPNSIKSTTSRLVNKEFKQHLSEYYWKPYFWSRSYLILSSGGAPIEVIKQYMRERGTEEHKSKSRRRRNLDCSLSPPDP